MSGKTEARLFVELVSSQRVLVVQTTILRDVRKFCDTHALALQLAQEGSETEGVRIRLNTRGAAAFRLSGAEKEMLIIADEDSREFVVRFLERRQAGSQ